mmetsp:Transcript_10226/g.31983  ORF Transcript_10226/g.31983 Transcript_10226/m.31983 type:complete len:271 (+) Transcript_10226:1694-2506(+)
MVGTTPGCRPAGTPGTGGTPARGTFGTASIAVEASAAAAAIEMMPCALSMPAAPPAAATSTLIPRALAMLTSAVCMSGFLTFFFLHQHLSSVRHLLLHCVPVRCVMRRSHLTSSSWSRLARSIACSSSSSSLSDQSSGLAASLGAMSLYHFSRHWVKVRVPIFSEMAVQSILSRCFSFFWLSSTLVEFTSSVLPMRRRDSMTSFSSMSFSSCDQRPFLRLSPSLISRHLFATAFSLRSSCLEMVTHEGLPLDCCTRSRSFSSSSSFHLPL